MIGRGVLPNAQIYVMLMDSSSTMGNLKDAFGFFDEMVEQAVRKTFSVYIHVVATRFGLLG